MLACARLCDDVTLLASLAGIRRFSSLSDPDLIVSATRPGFYLIFTNPQVGQAHLPVLNSAVSLLTRINF